MCHILFGVKVKPYLYVFVIKKKSNNKGIFATVALLYLPPDLSLPLTVYCALKKMFQYDTKLAK